jgi:hypothetical protein
MIVSHVMSYRIDKVPRAAGKFAEIADVGILEYRGGENHNRYGEKRALCAKIWIGLIQILDYVSQIPHVLH